MPDTPRSLADILTLFPINTSGAISPQDLRDFVVSQTSPVIGGGFDVPAVAHPNYIIYKSGSTYYAANKRTGATDFSNANAGQVINSACAALTSGGVVALQGGIDYNCTSKIGVPAHVHLVGPEHLPDNRTQGANLIATATIAGGLVQLTGASASVQGLYIDGNGNSDHGVRMMLTGQYVRDCAVAGGKLNGLWFDGPSGAARCGMFNCRIDNASDSGGASLRVDGPDHLLGDFRITGAAAAGYSMVLSGSHSQVANAHVTAADTCAANTLIDASTNSLDNVLFDTGPNGVNGDDQVSINAGQIRLTGCTFYNSKVATSNAVAIRKDSAGDYRQGVQLIGCDWDGTGGGATVWAYAVALLTETGTVPTALARWAGLEVLGGHVRGTTDLTNVALSTATDANSVRFRDIIKTANSTSAPLVWASDNSGKSTQSGDGAHSVYTIAHGLGYTPSFVIVEPASADANAVHSVTANATNITITYNTNRLAGTNNLSWYWMARL